MKKSLSLAARFGLLFCGATLALVIVLSTTLFSYFRTDVEKSLLSSFSLTVDNNAQTVNDLLTRLDLYMNLVIDNNAVFLDTLKTYDGNLFNAYHNYLRMQDILKSNLDVTFGSLISDCSAIFIVNPDMPLSQILSRFILSDFSMTPISSSVHTTLPAPYENESWYRRSLEQPDADYWFALPENKNVLYVIRRLKATELVEYRVLHYDMGAIVVAFDASWLDTAVNRDDPNGSFELFLLDGERRVIYCADERQRGLTFDELTPGAASGEPVMLNFDGESCYAWQKSLQSGLTMVTLLPREQIASLSFGSLRIVALAASLLLLAGFALILLLSRYATEPIRRLALHMQGETLAPIPTPPRARPAREVGLLYASFNSQIEYIGQLIGEVRASERAQRQTEVRLLQAQINPHFVCNALDSVCCRALMRGDDDLADILGDLADIMRYNLRNPSEQIPLARELDIVRRFVRIQQARNAEPIVLRFDVQEKCQTALVPKLILQPLVENAIFHSDDPSSIRVEARIEEDGGTLILRVYNHSEETDVSQINAHIAGEITLSSKSTGLSIRNIHQRITLAYGDAYGLRFDVDPDSPGGIVATMTLPLRREQD